MNSVLRLLAGLTALLGLTLASAPSQAISVVGDLGWQPVPGICAVAQNIRFNVAQRKLHFQCGPSAVQFACTPAGNVTFFVNSQRVNVACASNTVSALASSWSPFPGAPPIACNNMTNFNYDAQERTVTFTCPNIAQSPRTCYPSDTTTQPPPEPGTPNTSPPAPDYENGTVSFGYCAEAELELVGHSGFEPGELWRPAFRE